MNPSVRSFGKLTLVTYTIPTVPVMSMSFKIGLMFLVIAAVLLGIILSMVIAITMLPIATVKAHLLMTMPSVPFIIGRTVGRTMS